MEKGGGGDMISLIREKAGAPVRYFCIWLVSLIYWEFLLRICIGGGIRSGNLPLLVFIPAEALFLTALGGILGRNRLLCSIVNTIPGIILALYYTAQLVYHRLAGSLLPVGMLGAGGQAIGDFGWTMRRAIIRTLVDIPLMLLPAAVIFFLSFRIRKSDPEEAEKTDPPTLRGYVPWLRIPVLALALILWFAGAASLSAFGRGRDSAWYAYHSDLADTDSSAEHIGALTTTVVELYIYSFGQEQDLSETVSSTINMEALELPDRNMEEEETAKPAPASVTAADNETKAETAEEEGEKEEAEEEPQEEPDPPRPWQDDHIDFHALAEMTEDENIKVLCDHFASRRPTSTNEYTGLFEGYNLIYICCEAFSGYGIDPEITPLLYKMANGGIVLENFYNSFRNITTNGEYAFTTSLWPDVSRSAGNGSVAGSFPRSSAVFMPYGLGDLFAAEGVNSYAYHNYRGDYYLRDHSWENLGYDSERMKFMGSGMTFSTPWPASDLEMMEQSVDDFIDEDRFHAYYMTFSGHGPFDESNYMFVKNIKKVRELAGDRYRDEQCLGYFCGEYELELAMEYLTERLEEAGKLDNTVIVMIGDHFPYYLSDEAVKEFNGGTMPDSIERCRSTCIIYNSGMEEPVHSDAYCCNVDILPTILNLFNIGFDSRLLMGTDIFSEGIHRARLYNGSFVTKYLCYDRTDGSKNWSYEAESLSEEDREAYLEAMLDYTESEYAVSLGMLENDFYYYVWKNAGIMSAEEAEAEEARQEKSRSLYRSREQTERTKAEEAAAQKAAEEAEKAAEQEAPADGTAPAPAGGETPAPAEGAVPAVDGQNQ